MTQASEVLNTRAATIPVSKPWVEPPVRAGQSTRTEDSISPRLADLLLRLSRLRIRQVVDRFIVILAWIHEQEADKFECAQQIRVRTRIYFSRSRGEIEESGKSSFPVEIETTGWYVSSNNSTPDKKKILDQLLRLLSFPDGVRVLILRSLDLESEEVNLEPRTLVSRPIKDDDDLQI